MRTDQLQNFSLAISLVINMHALYPFAEDLRKSPNLAIQNLLRNNFAHRHEAIQNQSRPISKKYFRVTTLDVPVCPYYSPGA